MRRGILVISLKNEQNRLGKEQFSCGCFRRSKVC